MVLAPSASWRRPSTTGSACTRARHARLPRRGARGSRASPGQTRAGAQEREKDVPQTEESSSFTGRLDPPLRRTSLFYTLHGQGLGRGVGTLDAREARELFVYQTKVSLRKEKEKRSMYWLYTCKDDFMWVLFHFKIQFVWNPCIFLRKKQREKGEGYRFFCELKVPVLAADRYLGREGPGRGPGRTARVERRPPVASRVFLSWYSSKMTTFYRTTFCQKVFLETYHFSSFV